MNRKAIALYGTTLLVLVFASMTYVTHASEITGILNSDGTTTEKNTSITSSVSGSSAGGHGGAGSVGSGGSSTTTSSSSSSPSPSSPVVSSTSPASTPTSTPKPSQSTSSAGGAGRSFLAPSAQIFGTGGETDPEHPGISNLEDSTLGTGIDQNTQVQASSPDLAAAVGDTGIVPTLAWIAGAAILLIIASYLAYQWYDNDRKRRSLGKI
jgi:hypothetical protein